MITTGQSRGSRVTMGSMSASDAAPLPRLGEVYFDVRGESRSMRLSWYADTGVAVFSIWHGGPGHQGRAGGPARPGYGPGYEEHGPGEYRADEYAPGEHDVGYGPGDSG